MSIFCVVIADSEEIPEEFLEIVKKGSKEKKNGVLTKRKLNFDVIIVEDSEQFYKMEDEVFRSFVIGDSDYCSEAMPLSDGIFTTRNNVVNKQYKNFERHFGNLSYYGEKRWRSEENEYLDLLANVLTNGELRSTRNAMTYSIFGSNIEFNLKNFPLLTTKKMFFRGVVEELLFFLRGETNTKILEEKGINIWKGNTSREFLDSVGLKDYQEGDMGPTYGFNWRYYGAEYQGCDKNYKGQGIDQLEKLIDKLCNKPTDRRLVMTTWDIRTVDKAVLPPCHGLVDQFYVSKGKLSCKVYQRSADLVLGLPFNIASYAALVHILCVICTNRGYPLTPGKLFISLGDAHVYQEHEEGAIEQLFRIPFDFPQLSVVSTAKTVEELSFGDFKLSNYEFYPPVKVDMIA
jgi:thymidylate synthase